MSKIQVPKKPKCIVLDERVSDGYYAYVLTLYCHDGRDWKLIDEEAYGDMSYWGIPNEVKPFERALRKLLRRNNLTENDVEIKSCGFFTGRSCWDVLYSS